MFHTLRERDLLVHHPYESFESSVGAFLTAAAEDPAVRVIMTTLYRTGGSESSIVQALQGAAARGKQIVVLVELKARFDEAHNLERARALERAGAHVVYGVLGLKTHTKLTFVVREEYGRLQRYCHVATGNYNPVTAALYEDLGLFTSRVEVTRDVAELFQRLTSGSGWRSYEKLLVAPEGLRAGMLERIGREARPGGRIVDEAERALRPGDHRRALRRVGRGRGDRPDRARHLLPAAGRRGPLRADPRALGARPLPRALADLPLRRAGRRARSGSAPRT